MEIETAPVPLRAWSLWEASLDPSTIIALAAASLVRSFVEGESDKDICHDEEMEHLVLCTLDMDDELAEEVLKRTYAQALALTRHKDAPGDAVCWMNSAFERLRTIREEALYED